MQNRGERRGGIFFLFSFFGGDGSILVSVCASRNFIWWVNSRRNREREKGKRERKRVSSRQYMPPHYVTRFQKQ